jgi:hypothetical protein
MPRHGDWACHVAVFAQIDLAFSPIFPARLVAIFYRQFAHKTRRSGAC